MVGDSLYIENKDAAGMPVLDSEGSIKLVDKVNDAKKKAVIVSRKDRPACKPINLKMYRLLKNRLLLSFFDLLSNNVTN